LNGLDIISYDLVKNLYKNPLMVFDIFKIVLIIYGLVPDIFRTQPHRPLGRYAFFKDF
jgi:hypothetical protein